MRHTRAPYTIDAMEFTILSTQTKKRNMTMMLYDFLWLKKTYKLSLSHASHTNNDALFGSAVLD